MAELKYNGTDSELMKFMLHGVFDDIRVVVRLHRNLDYRTVVNI